ncbi:MAG TPA: tetratricopeptide repeat protein [Thermoanaerobaculia bacterium]|nr:tetratricopeptide repeat protein [Thermoanaerobaculia bacterium]
MEPGDAEAHLHLGLALQGLGRESAAAEALGRAAALRPEDPAYHRLLGEALGREGRFEEAVEAIRQALLLDPSDARLHCLLARQLRGLGRLDGALAAYGEAIRLRPALARAHYGRATTLLAMGRFHEAWEDFEWRDELPEAASTRHRHDGYAAPRWRGEPFQRRTLLVGIEQGAGDIFQFVRYLRPVKARGGRVLLECRSEHRQLFRHLAGADELVARGAEGVPFDLFVPLLSLPGLFGTVPETIPSEVPYLFADPFLVARWRDAVPSGPETRVGLVWGGSPRHAGDRQRSAPLAAFQPLAAIPGIRVFSLQQGGREAELATAAPALRFENLGARTQGYAETAAVIANLDLVVSVDTSVAHLAAAMGKTVWVLLAVDADWRWGRESDRSPWYPTVRLFRQSRPGDWVKVIDQVARALHPAA